MSIRAHLTIFLVLPAALLAQGEGQSERIASLQAGIICPPETVGSAPAPGTLAGTTHIIDADPPFVSTERRVPAVLGIGFGIKATAADAAGIDNVTMVVTHPPMGKTQAQVQSFGTAVSGVSTSLTFYQFDYAYELVYGTWEMAAIKDDQTLYRVRFEVVPPQQVPELAAICGFEELLS
ncbi:DUF3859 domain-containing protein [Yoonia sp. SS1-5]|uniref:DUF3859 domain-containing protein n=1 Tax=Yoonia rhodophyticola TaxID=3137370 RepID=A0AAN0MBG3_9RHOB